MAGSCGAAEGVSDPALIVVLGPTASGKTGLSLDIAEACQGEIVVMDSAQVYAGLPIGTAKPTSDEVARVPHHLLGCFDWEDICTAARWAAEARRVITEIQRRNKIPILCGGTFLYLRALLEGLHPLPSSDPEYRQRLVRRAAEEGTPALHAELAQADPHTAARIHPNDTQRTLRALEILAQSGQGREASFSAVEELPAWTGPVLRLGLMPGDRAQLRERIALRFHQMLEMGLWDEVKAALTDPRFNPELPVLKAVGYRQLYPAVEGQCEPEEAVTQAITATRQYAKRQLTWLRRDPELIWLNSADKGLSEYARTLCLHWLRAQRRLS